jgi:hypothetical protein
MMTYSPRILVPRTRVAALMVAACCAMAAGCSRPATGLVPVEGKALVNGKPAAGAIVTFHPVNGPDTAPRPSGRVDEAGTFHLATAAANDGAAPGEYRVTVAWYLASNAPRRGAAADESVPVSQLPLRYVQPAATPLRVTVSADQREPLTLDIKKK